MFFITNDNRLLQGKTKLEALQQICPYIYWKGNNPYGVEFVQSNHKIVCWRVNSNNIAKGSDYYTVSSSSNGFDYVTTYTSCGKQFSQSITKSNI